MTQGACQCQSLRLSAGKAYPSAANPRLHSLAHFRSLLIQTNQLQVRYGIPTVTKQDIFRNTVRKKLRIVTKIADPSGALCLRCILQFPSVIQNLSLIRILAQKCLSKC